MASLYSKFLDFIGIEEGGEIDDDRRDDYYDDQDDRYDRNDRYERSERTSGRDRERERGERDRYDRGEDRNDNVVSFNNRASARSSRSERTATGGNLPISGGMKMIVYHPVSYEDTQAIIDNLKNRKPVIVNMEELEVDSAQRILDFLSGAVYALNGTMCKISRGIFVVAPNNYDVVGNGEDDYDDLV